MAIDITVPAAGESITSANIAKWYKNDGDSVKKGEPLAVIFSNDRKKLDESLPMFGKSFSLGDAFEPSPLICEVI